MCFSELAGDPVEEEVDGFLLLIGRKRHATLHLPPFLHAPPAAHSAGMHRLEHRMPPHGRLPAIVGRIRVRQLQPHEILRMTPDRLHPHPLDILQVPLVQPEPAPKPRPPQPLSRLLLRHCHPLRTLQIV